MKQGQSSIAVDILVDILMLLFIAMIPIDCKIRKFSLHLLH